MRISDWSSDVCSSDLKSVSGTHIAVDIGYAEIDAVEERSVMVVTAAKLNLIDFIAEIRVAEGIARGRDKRCVERVETGEQLIGDDRLIAFEIDPLVCHPYYRIADRHAGSIFVGRFRRGHGVVVIAFSLDKRRVGIDGVSTSRLGRS